jgi:hypothetical protein
MVPLITDAEKKKRRDKVRQKRQKSGRRCRPLPPRKEGSDQQYKEFKDVVFYDEDQEHRYVNVTSGDHSVAGRMIQRMALQVDLKTAGEKIGNVDGSPWIRNEIEFYGLVDTLGLDYYHLRDNVQKTRRVVYGEENPSGQEWKSEIMSLFYDQGCERAWERLLSWRSTLRGGMRKEADRLVGYVAQRRDMIRYPKFRQHGWQIGSGPTEAQCKASAQRVKGRGRRWDRANAEAVIALDCLASSDVWHLHWTNLDDEPN